METMIFFVCALFITATRAQNDTTAPNCITEFNTVGQCLDETVDQMHKQTLDPFTRKAIDACFTSYQCKTPEYDTSNFGSLPEGLSSLGEGLITRWFALPESKRVCVRQRLYVERKKIIESCYGGTVPDVGESPRATQKGNAHRQALINVQIAQQACHAKLGGTEVTMNCVPAAYKAQTKSNKCQVFGGCARNIVSPQCIVNFQNQHGQYCSCREKAYSQSIGSIISFSSDLAQFSKLMNSLSTVANNPTANMFGLAQNLFGPTANNMVQQAGNQLRGLFGGSTNQWGNLLNAGMGQAQGYFGNLFGGGLSNAGAQQNPNAGANTLLSTLFGGQLPAIPRTGAVLSKVTEALSDCGIDGKEFAVSAQDANLKRYCGCDKRDVFNHAFCFVNCAQRGQTVKDLEQLIMVLQGQIEPRQEESFFCNGCF